MKKLIISAAAILVFGSAFAQSDSKTPAQQKPSEPMPVADSTSTNSQIRKESDIKTMDAVKTDDHPKITPTANDTLTNKNKKKSKKAKK
jgi:hypothetical protein